MKYSFNRDHLTVGFQIENEDDLLNAYQLEKMMQTDEFKVLLMAWGQVRLMYEDAIKKVKTTEQSFREIGVKAAAFNGFDEAILMCGKIVDTAKKYREEKKEEIRKQLEGNKGEKDYGSGEYEPEPSFNGHN